MIDTLKKNINIAELIDNLTYHFEEAGHLTLEGFKGKLENLTFDCVKELISFDEKTYCKKVLYRVEDFEVILICWLPYQQTPLHSHPDNGCLMKILKGRLNEVRTIGKGIKESTLEEGDVTYLDGEKKHTITNMQDKSISLHIYSPSGFYE